MKISKFKIYHIILVVVFILALVFLKYDQSLYRNIFYIVLIISLIVKIIYDYVKKNRTTRLKGTRNDNGLLYVFIDKKKYLLAKLVYKYFGDREKIIAVGDDGVIIYRDGNKINLRIENLDYISRSEFNKTRDINKKIKHNRKSNKQNN